MSAGISCTAPPRAPTCLQLPWSPGIHIAFTCTNLAVGHSMSHVCVFSVYSAVRFPGKSIHSRLRRTPESLTALAMYVCKYAIMFLESRFVSTALLSYPSSPCRELYYNVACTPRLPSPKSSLPPAKTPSRLDAFSTSTLWHSGRPRVA